MGREQNAHAAQRPTEIPKAGWKDIALRVKDEIKDDHLSLLAGGVAFKALLALFPGIVAAISIWALVADPQQMVEQAQTFTQALPSGAGQLIEDQVANVAQSGRATLSVALGISVALALWGASGGMAGLMEGATAAYDEIDTRKFPIRRGIALLLTVGAILFLLFSLSLIAVLPPLLDRLGLPQGLHIAVQVMQWVVLAAVMVGSLAVVYKYGPGRDHAQFRWVTPGAVIATVLWLIGSALFTLYVNNFGNFGETYGAFAGIIVLMLWLMLTAFIVLLGAEINAETERQTVTDTTVGQPQPLGRRGANPADTTPADIDSPRR
ncbi:MAG TPA: YihY/virulence factor BrkB family protein [Egibacteraceae bacterium]|nr:YihY/virulence factor BrkB family protein [Egibacteraceae bacterium]